MSKGGNMGRSAALLCMMLAGILAGCKPAADNRKLFQGGALPTATAVGTGVCTSCHFGMMQTWIQTPHANMDPNNPGDLNFAGYPTMAAIGGAGCTKNCHNLNNDSNNLVSGITGNVARPVVGCEACHGNGSNHYGTGPIGPTRLEPATFGSVAVSGWVNTCNDCHELLDTTTGGIAAPVHRVGGPVPPNGTQFDITQQHFATTGNWTGINGANLANITGYAMDYSSESACENCHNSHNSSFMDINREWAQSRHADMTAAGAWAHYNWSTRTTCQRCKITASFADYADALAAGNAAGAEAIRNGSAPPLAADPNFKPTMLECNGCHTDNNGTLRNPGAYTAVYEVVISGTSYAKVPHQYADLSGSNICMTCHTGRNNGEALKQLSSSLYTNLSFRNVEPHELPSAGTMFTALGYAYANRNYANPTDYKHDKIGTPALPIDGGPNGPCVGCHMYRPGASSNHLFRAVNKNGSGNITGVTSDVCFNTTCHPGSNSALATTADNERLAFVGALTALQNQLTASGYPYNGAVFPPFATTNWTSANDPTGKNNLGAAFNFLFLTKDPGAYIHNSKYTKRLIYDSLDWLDDNKLNYSVGGSALAATCNVAVPPAMCSYLLPNGDLWTGVYPDGFGNPAERP